MSFFLDQEFPGGLKVLEGARCIDGWRNKEAYQHCGADLGKQFSAKYKVEPCVA